MVVGAGISGLYIAHRLAQRGEKSVVLEARAKSGGRIRSVYDEHHRLLYEGGPWRIAEDHKRTLSLFRELGIPLVPLQTPPVAQRPPVTVLKGLSNWDVYALQGGLAYADTQDRETGYADQTSSASGSSPYTTDSSRFFVAHDGFTELVDRLSETAQILYEHRVEDVLKRGEGYIVKLVVRTGHNRFMTLEKYTERLYVCVPPGVSREWSIFKEWGMSVMNAVTPGPLHHIYVKSKEFPRFTHTKDGNSLVAQTISSQYDNDWFQLSYSGGRVARFWNHLKLAQPLLFRQTLASFWPVALSAPIKSHFWPVALHQWVPVPFFDLQRAVEHAVCPNPKHLPNVYLAGEAFSSHQAWMEGALQTADLALTHKPSPPPDGTPQVFVEGLPIDVSRWMTRHPGGMFAIQNHRNEDVTAIMRQILHSPYAWAVVHSLKR